MIEINVKQSGNITNSVFIGKDAGIEIIEGDGIVIIGDGIKNLNPADNKNVLFIGTRVAIGTTINGVKFNLKEVIGDFITKNKF